MNLQEHKIISVFRNKNLLVFLQIFNESKIWKVNMKSKTMQFSWDDFTLCNDQLVSNTDNPLGGKRKRNKVLNKALGVVCSNIASKKSMHHCHDILENVVQIGASLPESLALSVSCLVLNNTLIYLLGTDHVNPKCKIEVGHIINLVKPDKVLVELCRLRACHCPTHMTSIFQNPAQFTLR